MMKILISVLIIILLVSYTEKVEEPKPLIEIYQLNKRIVSHEGEPFVFTEEMTEMDPEFTNAYKDILRVTDDGKWTPNGAFKAVQSDLQQTPLISDDEIKGFDFTTNQLLLNENACSYFGIIKTINDPYPDTQLVMTINKKTFFNFYRAGTMSKWRIGNSYYVIHCDLVFSNEVIKDNAKLNRKNTLRFSKDSLSLDSIFWERKPNLKQDTTFYNAFKRAGKIIDE